MITVEIDKLTPCLIKVETGEIVETTERIVKNPKELKGYNKTTGWYENWSALVRETEVHALYVKGDLRIQGLVALQKDDNTQAVYIAWAVAAPHNNSYKFGKKEYEGVGGHLFAIAVNKSIAYGFDGVCWGIAMDKTLELYYIEKLGGNHIGISHDFQFGIFEKSAKRIKETYTYDSEQE